MSSAEPIFLTVIVPVLNGEQFVSRAIASIRSQDFNAVEVLVFDGGSTDQTLTILEDCPGLIVISGPDLGPHDVMNRGIEMAQGEVIAFLNSDDFFVKNIFQEVRDQFLREPSLEIVGGGSAIVKKKGNHGFKIVAERTHEVRSGLSMEELVMGAPCFNTRFFRKTVFQKIGKFNLDYQYAADRDLLLRAAISGITAKTIKRLFYVFESHGNSRTIDKSSLNQNCISEEHRKIAKVMMANLTPKHRHCKLLRAWLSFEYLQQLIWNLKRANWNKFWRLFRDAFQADANWLLLGIYGFFIAKRLWNLDQIPKGYEKTALEQVVDS